MVVNANKMAMVCMSGATNYTADPYILDADKTRIGCTNEIKALGVRFFSNLDMEAQVRHIVKTMRARYWMLQNLKSNGFTTAELVQVYKTMLRPIVEYGCPVYHSSLTDEQDERLERLQDHALKCIFGPEKSARTLRGMAEIGTLRDRREEIVKIFALKCSNDLAFDHWFPRREAVRNTRNKNSKLNGAFNSWCFKLRKTNEERKKRPQKRGKTCACYTECQQGSAGWGETLVEAP